MRRALVPILLLIAASCAFGGIVVTAPSNQSGVEGSLLTINLGSFTDGAPATNYFLSINWGDGSPNFFTSTFPGLLGTGQHTYAEEGSYTVTLTANDTNSQLGSGQFGMTISDAPLTAGGGTILLPNAFSNATVGSFSDANPSPDFADFSATIDWGDASPLTAGTIQQITANTFSVLGSHTYFTAGYYNITTTVNDSGLSSVQLQAEAVPEPASFALGLAGLLVCATSRRRSRR
jgi:hypothetical protein